MATVLKYQRFCIPACECCRRLTGGLEVGGVRPVEVLLSRCLFPHIHAQYSRVCTRLVSTMKDQYQLIQYLHAMRVTILHG